MKKDVALACSGQFSWRLRKAVLRHLLVGKVDQVAGIGAKSHRSPELCQ
jgi:hypothetical protein